MTTGILNRRAFRFFHENAGYIVGERALCAAALARAESALADDDSFRVRWEDDPDPDLSWMDAEEAAAQHEVYGCIIEHKCGTCGAWQHAASLWGIVDPDDNYRRVVEAELACEALQVTP